MEHQGLLGNAHGWVVESIIDDPSFVERRMFGCLACYVHGRLAVVLADGEAPWNGVLFPTSREHHDSICTQFPELSSHPILGKWLFIAADCDAFEKVVQQITSCIKANDPRFGVLPSEETTKKKSARAKKRKVKNTPRSKGPSDGE